MKKLEEYPNWGAFTPELAAQRLPQLLEAAEHAIAELERTQPTSYEALVWGMDDATRELWHTWGAISHLLSVMNSEAWRQLQAAWQPKIVEFSLRVGQSRELYEAAKRLLDGSTLTDATRRRIVEKLVEGAELAGVGMAGTTRERFNAIQAELAKLGTDYHNAVIDATTPEIADAAYVESMKHERDRAKRERLCRARATRASENAARVTEILKLRQEEAKLLGFDNYAERSLKTKCAPSTAAVLKMIDELDRATKAPAEREEAELLATAEDANDVQPWDRAFLAERLRETKYDYSEEELKRCFELEAVLAGLWKITKLLTGVEVKEVEKPAVWHPSVRFFEVSEGGNAIAHFYFDPYVRTGLKSGGAWMNEFRNRSVREGKTELPLAVIVTNFQAPDNEGRTLLPFREVETLFHEFGHALQQMLTRVDEEDAAGINLVEWDAVEVASQFMENWCLDDRTGIDVPAELKAKVRAAKNFRAASVCRRQLAFAKLDMKLHATTALTQTPDEIKREYFDHFGLKCIEGDGFLNAFTHIFAGGYAAGYYGYKWAEVMSADCYGAFEEAGLEDEANVKRVGNRYRETILAMGGSKSALEVFREFRGRDPEITALLRQQGLN